MFNPQEARKYILDKYPPVKQEIEDWKKLSNDAGKLELERLICAQRIQRDFKLLVWCLGYKDLGKFHEREIDELGKVRKIPEITTRRLYLWSRGFFKTSIITISHSIYLIINNCDVRILLVSYTIDVAKKIISELKSHFVSNESFRYFFREFCPVQNKEGKIEFGTSEMFITPARKKVYKEPTVMVAGVGTNLTTLHFDYHKIDDLVTMESVTNDTQINSSKEYYASLRQLFDRPTKPCEDIIGTTYHFNDLYADIKKSPEFIKSIIPARNEEGLFFPERFDNEGLNKILNDPLVGPWAFNAQYLLNPIDPAKAKFKSEWLKEYETLPEGLAEYILIDPASTQKKKSDFTVIERWGIDANNNHYLLEGIRDKLTVFQRIDKIVEIARRCKRLQALKYEVLGGRHGDLETLKKRFMDEQLPIIPQETKSTTSSKADRIEQRLVGQFYAGKIYLPKTCFYHSEHDGKTYDFIQDYKLEYLQFPFSEHDDCLDCHSQMFEEPTMLIKGLSVNKEEKKEWGTADDWDELYREIDSYQYANPFLTREQAINMLRVKRLKDAMRKVCV